MAKFISANRMPHPWHLDEDWFDRLEISEADRRHYRHLSEAELQWLEASREMVTEYAGWGFLRAGKTPNAFVKRAARDLDHSWLTPGKGRAVDFKHALSVLETYADYVQWASAYNVSQRELLDLILPYWVRDGAPLYEHYGPGFAKITCTVYNPSLGKKGEVTWGQIVIEFTELEFTKKWGKHDVIAPFSRLKEPYSPRSFAIWRTDGPPDSFGLQDEIVSRIAWVFRQRSWRGCPLIRPDQNPHVPDRGWATFCRVSFDRPEQVQVQEIFNHIASVHFEGRYPKGQWQLQFDVAPDLAITVATIGTEFSPFGVFYDWRKEPLNP